jgi:NAD-dependent deacetylase
MIVAGTSASVYPCAGLPFLAKRNRAIVIECNLEPTEFTRRITDVFVQGRSGEMLPALVAALNLS